MPITLDSLTVFQFNLLGDNIIFKGAAVILKTFLDEVKAAQEATLLTAFQKVIKNNLLGY